MTYKYKIKHLNELKKYFDERGYRFEEICLDFGDGISFGAFMSKTMLSCDYVLTKEKINYEYAVFGRCFTRDNKSRGIYRWEPWMVNKCKTSIMDTE